MFMHRRDDKSEIIANGTPVLPAVAISWIIGIVCSLICREYSFGGLVIAALALIGASFLALHRNRLALSFTLGLAAITLSGCLMALAQQDGFSKSDLRYLLAQGDFKLNEPVSFEGCVVSESEVRGEEIISTVELRAFLQKDRWVACKGNGILRIAESSSQESQAPKVNLMRGDRVRGWAVWRRPGNFENPGSTDRAGLLARRGIFITGRIKSSRLLETIPGDCSNPWTGMANSVRMHVRASLAPIKEKEKGQPAAILSSLILGDYSGLNNATREVFQNTGTFHVLVVSGLHVAWIAGLLLQFLKLLRLPERIRFLLAALGILLYTIIIGFQASITRCLWMFFLYLIGRLLFRRADALNILFATALILLVLQPAWLFETGFQLSFLSVMAIALTAAPAIDSFLKPVWEPLKHAGDPHRLFLQPGSWHRRGRKLRTHCEILIEAMTDTCRPFVARMLFLACRCAAGTGLALGSMIIISVSVQLWIEPLLAYNFNRMSWISPLANLVIVPFSSIVLAAGIIGSLTSGLPFCSPALIQFAGYLASLLLAGAETITSATDAWQRCPTPSAIWIIGGILLLFIWSFFEWRRRWIPCLYIAALLACLSTGSMPIIGDLFNKCRLAFHPQEKKIWQENDAILSFTFLDVGEGDAIVIRFPNKQLWLLDAGGLRLAPSQEDAAYSFDIGEAVVSRYLWHEWARRLDRLILSHTDLDHAGGVPAIMKNFRIAGLDYSIAGAEDAILGGIVDLARKKQITMQPLHGGMMEKVGPVTVRILHPPDHSNLISANENSLVLQFSFKQFSAILTGDLEKSGEASVLKQPEDLRSQLLKVAHHGSRMGTSNAFLDRVRPRWAVVSVGRNNPFGHPSPDAMSRLLHHGTKPFQTLNEGAITFETNGVRYVIRSYINGILEQGELVKQESGVRSQESE